MKSNEYWGIDQYRLNPYIYYDPVEWKNLKVKKEANIEIIKKDLASKIPLETQFKNNSNKRLVPSKLSSHEKKALLKIKKIENIFFNK